MKKKIILLFVCIILLSSCGKSDYIKPILSTAIITSSKIPPTKKFDYKISDIQQLNNNCKNMSFVYKTADYLYYVNGMKGQKLYRRSITNKTQKPLSFSLTSVFDFNVVNDVIYGTDCFNDRPIMLFSYNIKTKKYEYLNKSPDNNIVGNIQYSSQRIYYDSAQFFSNSDRDNTNRIYYSIKYDGSDLQEIKINKSLIDWILVDNIIFYTTTIDEFQIELHRLDLKSNKSELISNTGGFNLLQYNNYIYYTNSNQNLIRISFDGKTKNQITKCKVYERGFNFCDDLIYFANVDDENKLYKMNLDGTNMVKASDISVGNIAVIGDEVYFRTPDMVFDIYMINKDGKIDKIT